LQHDYDQFSSADFLTDDFFVSHHLAPTPQSTAFWEAWSKEHSVEQWQQAVSLLDAIRLGLDGYAQTCLPEETIRQLLIRIQQTNARQRKAAGPGIRLARIKWVAAASISLAIGIWWLTYTETTPYEHRLATLEKTFTEKINTTEQPQLIQLPDQSVVSLNPKSRLSYPADFGQKNRLVYLSGEATFAVTKDTRKPFLVLANELVTKVVGTKFRIRAFSKEDQVRVQVLSGQVSVYRDQANPERVHQKGVLLLPNQQVVFTRETDRFDKSLISQPFVLKIPGRLKQSTPFVYNETPMAQVLQDVKEAYGIDILYNKEALIDCQLTSSMDGLSFDQKLMIICKTVGATYDVIDGQVVINGGNCR
jgi:ferric-dicitrate binding protein FerR (iron transport regulator)